MLHSAPRAESQTQKLVLLIWIKAFETQAGTNGSTAEIGTKISAEISDGEIIDGGQEIGEEVGGTADLGGDPAEDDEPKE